MRKQTIQYTSSLDALIAVAKRLSVYENQHKMDSEDFYNEYNQGILSDDIAVLASVRHRLSSLPCFASRIRTNIKSCCLNFYLITSIKCDRRSGRVRSLKPLRLRHDLIFGNAPPLRLWFRLVTVLGVWEGEFRLK